MSTSTIAFGTFMVLVGLVLFAIGLVFRHMALTSLPSHDDELLLMDSRDAINCGLLMTAAGVALIIVGGVL